VREVNLGQYTATLVKFMSSCGNYCLDLRETRDLSIRVSPSCSHYPEAAHSTHFRCRLRAIVVNVMAWPRLFIKPISCWFSQMFSTQLCPPFMVI